MYTFPFFNDQVYMVLISIEIELVKKEIFRGRITPVPVQDIIS